MPGPDLGVHNTVVDKIGKTSLGAKVEEEADYVKKLINMSITSQVVMSKCYE